MLADARQLGEYAHVVESELDVIVQEVATRGQAEVALANRQFLAADWHLVLAIKARSEDVSADPEAVFENVRDRLAECNEIRSETSLERYHADHRAVVATPK